MRADRKQLAENHTVVQAFGRAELQLGRHPAEAHGDLLGVIRLQRSDAVAYDHPVDHALVDEVALAARLDDEVGVMRHGAPLAAIVVHPGEHIDVDVTVVDR